MKIGPKAAVRGLTAVLGLALLVSTYQNCSGITAANKSAEGLLTDNSLLNVTATEQGQPIQMNQSNNEIIAQIIIAQNKLARIEFELPKTTSASSQIGEFSGELLRLTSLTNQLFKVELNSQTMLASLSCQNGCKLVLTPKSEIETLSNTVADAEANLTVKIDGASYKTEGLIELSAHATPALPGPATAANLTSIVCGQPLERQAGPALSSQASQAALLDAYRKACNGQDPPQPVK